ncbi:TRAP transporter permease [Treponema sp. OMZ 840]|uniref:TRAP transporter permease n=1 Tax=Treponema sp. OMZ 840 TaxID=244313 RepID=UPI003D908BB6
MEKKSVKNVTFINRIIFFLSLFITLFHLYVTMTTVISVTQSRVIHLFSFMLIWYLYRLMKNGKTLDIIISFLIIVLGLYFLWQTTPDIIREKGIWGITPLDVIAGVLLVVLILEISRQAIGIALPLIASVFIMYAFLGAYLPNLIAHRGYNITYVANYICWTNEGVFGTPIGAAVAFVVLYIIFGELLDKFGAGKFFIDIAYALTGKMRGGPAEAAVLSSALMGSINGSAVANVVTTGTFTIPLMKKIGYSKEYAGAVEAVASTGGQILPPVMGAAAFVMADLTGIEYSVIILAALLPGLLYYISLATAVFFEAARLGIKPEEDSKLKNMKTIFKEGYYHLFPLIVLLICLLGVKFSASYSALFAIGTVLLIGIVKTVKTERRFPFEELKQVFLHTAKSAVPVTIACASAGIVIGIISMTGLGVRFAQIVFNLAQGNIFFMLLMTMLACIILGMGLPSTAAYVIASTVAAPALLEAGISVIASNLFVFYFAIISFITPPVAMSAYAASGIADSDSMKTGIKAFLLGIAGFIIPFLFIYYPGLLIIDSSIKETIYALIIALCAVLITAAALEGWCFVKVPILQRFLMFGAAVFLIFPKGFFDIIGLILFGINLLVLLFQFYFQKQKRRTA